MSEEPPTLQELARQTVWIEGVGLSEQTVTQALVEAGIDPDDQNERERFLRLVKANYHYQQGEIAAILGTYFERATEDLGRDAPEEEILRHAFHLAEQDQSVRKAESADRNAPDHKTNPDKRPGP